jgi:hypothetical protein
MLDRIRGLLLIVSVSGLAGLLCEAVPAHAAAPPEPTYAGANVDGDTGEWNLENDFFANMYRAGNADKPVESKLYLRYDCPSQTLYALVLAQSGVPVLANLSGDQFVKLGNSTKLVDGNSGDDGTPADFAWVGLAFDGNSQHAWGWEASALLAPASYSNLNVHSLVYDDGEAQTSAVQDRAISLALDCSAGATLNIVKEVVNDGGGTLTSASFPVYVDGIPANWSTVSLAAGTHALSESPHVGYAPSVWGGDCSANGSVTLDSGESKTCTVTNDDYYFGGFVECVRPETSGYWVRFGYQWDGTGPVDMARSDLSPAVEGVSMPQVFQPGRHVLDDVFVPHTGNIVWTFGPVGFGTKTATASPGLERLCYAYCGEPDGDGWDCAEGLVNYEGVCRNQACPAESDCQCPTAGPRYELGDRVWYDTDRDGIQDSAEPGVHGVVVKLFGNGTCTGSALATRTTDVHGRYLFTNLPAATYCIAFRSLPSDWQVTLRDQGANDIDSDANRGTGQIGNIALQANDRTEDMGLFRSGSIGDRVWCDRNLNSRFDDGEGIRDVTVRLYADNNCDGREDKLLVTAITGPSGQYSFGNLPAGPLRSTAQMCYVVIVDSDDKDLRTCDLIFTQKKFGVLLNANRPVIENADFGFKDRASQHDDFVPEPGTALLLGGGLSGLLGYARLRSRKR